MAKYGYTKIIEYLQVSWSNHKEFIKTLVETLMNSMQHELQIFKITLTIVVGQVFQKLLTANISEQSEKVKQENIVTSLACNFPTKGIKSYLWKHHIVQITIQRNQGKTGFKREAKRLQWNFPFLGRLLYGFLTIGNAKKGGKKKFRKPGNNSHIFDIQKISLKKWRTFKESNAGTKKNQKNYNNQRFR